MCNEPMFCPCCGGYNIVFAEYTTNKGAIICRDCNLKLVAYGDHTGGWRKNATEKWNTRAEHPNTMQILELAIKLNSAEQLLKKAEESNAMLVKRVRSLSSQLANCVETCPNCGSGIDDEYDCCPYCGEEL